MLSYIFLLNHAYYKQQHRVFSMLLSKYDTLRRAVLSWWNHQSILVASECHFTATYLKCREFPVRRWLRATWLGEVCLHIVHDGNGLNGWLVIKRWELLVWIWLLLASSRLTRKSQSTVGANAGAAAATGPLCCFSEQCLDLCLCTANRNTKCCWLERPCRTRWRSSSACWISWSPSSSHPRQPS